MNVGESTAAAGGKKKRLSVERLYQKKSQHEHILLRPDTYIGSVEEVTLPLWVYDEGVGMVFRDVTFVPGLYKIFDEILVNAADNKQRDPNMNIIKVTIDSESNKISIWNNGRGIPVEMHKEENMYVPSLIFGHLLTSSNYDDEEQKVTGGRNGYGAKLCNIYSSEFTVETASSESGRKLKQTWRGNMLKIGEPKISDSRDDYTCISFKPDLAKFKMESLTKDTIALMTRRAYDIAGTCRGVRVVFNGQSLKMKSFRDYVNLYLQSSKSSNDDDDEDAKPAAEPVVHEVVNDRWEICVASSTRGFQQISFVNSIATTKGGSHVAYVADQVVSNIMAAVAKKNKGGVAIKPFQVKNHTWVFINCLIVNPTFDSQTKENMTLKAGKFGSKCALSEAFLKKVLRCGIVEHVLEWARFKSEAQLKQKCHSTKHSKIRGIPKLDDANDAGTKNSKECTLILTEGDSAKALAISGLSIVGRDRFGVFPLRGKVLNVREASHKQIMENAELSALIKILGLQYKKDYSAPGALESLRYGHIMIMTDQDQDGSHIKGLLINWLHYNWPSLFRHPGFLQEFITPIVKATKGKEELSFYSLPEFSHWLAGIDNTKAWKIKYYKGLGTSTHREAKEYFAGMDRHRIPFSYHGKEDDDSIKLAFSKKLAGERKEWITNWLQRRRDRRSQGLSESFLYDNQMKSLSYQDFINKELILFSNADNERSIPSLVDGLKPGQRKVLFTCFKRNDKREVKVAQLAGSVSELSAYHHGEASLMGTIINMAQDFVGSNNVNLLLPIGQFGTRLHGGKDAASARYIFTKLSPLARRLFPQADEANLRFLTEDNQRIEPLWYCPILPLVLINGAEGIGTGYSTSIPNFDVRDVIRQIRRLMAGREVEMLEPKYKGFNGMMAHVQPQRYAMYGCVGRLNDTQLEITELPIRSWTQVYKENVLEPMLHGTDKCPASIQDYREYHTEATVRFVITLTPANMAAAEKEGLYKKFKLESRLSTSNMVLFDADGCLRRYDNVDEILKEFYVLRSKRYVLRKEFLEGQLQAEADKLSAQARFITEKISGKLVMEDKPMKEIVLFMQKTKYPSDPVKEWKDQRKKLEDEEDIAVSDAEDSDAEDAAAPKSSGGPDYDYLLDMRMRSICKERKEDLLRQRDAKNSELDVLKKKTADDLWNEDLTEFEEDLVRREAQEREDSLAGLAVLAAANKKNKSKAAGGKAAAGGRAAKASAHLSMASTSTDPQGEFIPPTIPAFTEDAPGKVPRKKKGLDSVSEEKPGDLETGDGAEAKPQPAAAPSKPLSLTERLKKSSTTEKVTRAPRKTAEKAKKPQFSDDSDSDAFQISDSEDGDSGRAGSPAAKSSTTEKVARAPRKAAEKAKQHQFNDDSDSDGFQISDSEGGDDWQDDSPAAKTTKKAVSKASPAKVAKASPISPAPAAKRSRAPAKKAAADSKGKTTALATAQKRKAYQLSDEDEDSIQMAESDDSMAGDSPVKKPAAARPAAARAAAAKTSKAPRKTAEKAKKHQLSDDSDSDAFQISDSEDGDTGRSDSPAAKKSSTTEKVARAPRKAAEKAKQHQFNDDSDSDGFQISDSEGGDDWQDDSPAAKTTKRAVSKASPAKVAKASPISPAPAAKRSRAPAKKAAADSKGKTTALATAQKRKASQLSDEDEDSTQMAESEDSMAGDSPVKKPAAARPAAAKAAAAKTSKAARKPAAAAKSKPAPRAKKAISIVLSDSEDDSPPKAKAKPAAAKAAVKKKAKKAMVLSESEEEEEDNWTRRTSPSKVAVPVTSPMSRNKRARQPIKYSFEDNSDGGSDDDFEL